MLIESWCAVPNIGFVAAPAYPVVAMIKNNANKFFMTALYIKATARSNKRIDAVGTNPYDSNVYINNKGKI